MRGAKREGLFDRSINASACSSPSSAPLRDCSISFHHRSSSLAFALVWTGLFGFALPTVFLVAALFAGFFVLAIVSS